MISIPGSPILGPLISISGMPILGPFRSIPTSIEGPFIPLSEIFLSSVGPLMSFLISKSILGPLISIPVSNLFIPGSILTLIPKPFLFFPVLFFPKVFCTLIGAKPYPVLFKRTGSSTEASKIPLNNKGFPFSEDLGCFPFPKDNPKFIFGFPFKLISTLGPFISILGPLTLISGIEAPIFISISFGSISFLISISIGDLLGNPTEISFPKLSLRSPIFGNFINFSGI